MHETKRASPRGRAAPGGGDAAGQLELHKELERIARGVAERTPLLVGGRAAPAFSLLPERLGATVFTDLASFRGWLRGRSNG